MEPRVRPLVVDACVAINIRAADIWMDVFQGCGWSPNMPELAVDEVLYVLDHEGNRELVPLRELAAEGQFVVCQLDDVESTLTLKLAADLGPGEAAGLAIAMTRGMGFATDDRPAIRRSGELAPEMELVSTAQLVQTWAASNNIDRARAREVVSRIEARAQFRPRGDEAAARWWEELQQQAEGDARGD